MRLGVSPTLLGCMCVIASMAMVSAKTIFEEAFDGSQYIDDQPLMSGSTQTTFGQWSLNNKGQGSISISPALSLSASRSLALTIAESGDQAQAIAVFGTEGAKEPTSEAIIAKVAFYLSDTKGASTFFIIRGSGENSLGLAKVEAGTAWASFGDDGSFTSLGPIMPGVWYYLSFSMPANPKYGESSYKVVLYDTDGSTELKTASGKLYHHNQEVSSGDYSYLTVMSTNAYEQISTYFDDFSVQTNP